MNINDIISSRSENGQKFAPVEHRKLTKFCRLQRVSGRDSQRDLGPRLDLEYFWLASLAASF